METMKFNAVSGGIIKDEKLQADFITESVPHTIDALNDWFFSYFYNKDLRVAQLPPLDDWTHSQENSNYWSVKFPSDDWHVYIRIASID